MSVYFGKLKSFNGYSVGPGAKGQGKSVSLQYKGDAAFAGAYTGDSNMKGDQFEATFKTKMGEFTFKKTMGQDAWKWSVQSGTQVDKNSKQRSNPPMIPGTVITDLTQDATTLAEKSKRLAEVKTEKLDPTLTMMVYDDILKLDA